MSQEMQTEPAKQGRLGFISGVVPKVKAASFERILFRATRGNMFLKQAPVDEAVIDPATGEKVGDGWRQREVAIVGVCVEMVACLVS